MRFMKYRFMAIALSMLLLLAVVLIVRTLAFVPKEGGASSDIASFDIDREKAIVNLSRAIQFKTISHEQEEKLDKAEFLAFILWLKKTYPKVSATMNLVMVNELTPVYQWKGKNTALKPALLSAHYDVVPVSKDALLKWEHPPYSGLVKGGFVWGRGAIDNKVAVITILEAAEYLIGQGFQPERTFYFSFGHDEEVGGVNGASKVVDYFHDQGVELSWTLDEGSMVSQGVLAGIDGLLASINVAEKGFLTVELKTTSVGGHSSTPPPETAVGVISKAIYRLQENQVEGELEGLSEMFFDAVSRHFPLEKRAIFANRWLFGSVINSQIGKTPVGNALLRTTTAPTMLSGSDKANVLPTEATATVNFRIHPSDTVDDVLEHVRNTINDERVELLVKTARQPSPISDAGSETFDLIARALQASFGPMIIAPGLTIGGTDTKHYYKLADNSYRINPILVDKSDISRIHGISERISLDNIEKAVKFYVLLFESSVE